MEKQPYIRFNFDLNSENSGRPLNVMQLVTIIKEELLGSNFLKGCRLPPVRVLAHQLGLSKNTIQTAYDELSAQGIIESKDRTGLFVSKSFHLKEDVNSKIEQQNNDIIPEINFKNIPYIGAPKPKQENFISLSSVFVDPRILPKEKLTSCFKSILKTPGIPEFHDPQGMPALREKIAIRLRDRGMDVSADHVIITNGSQQALDLVIRSIDCKTIGTEDPSYHLGKNLFEMNGMKTVGLPIDPFSGIDEKSWEKKLRVERPGFVYLTTNFQNPNGYSYSSSEISKIINWAKEFNFGILEDDWGSEMLSFSEFRPGLRSLGGSNVLYMNSFTKKVMPSLRIGYLVANENNIKPLLMAKRVSTIAAPSLIEAALFEFLDRGYYDTHLKSMQEELDIRYDHALNLLREYMPQDVKWTTPGGGPVLWLGLPKKINLELLSQNLRQQGIIIQLSSNAFFGNPHSHGFKIGHAFLNQSEMEIAIEKLSNEIKILL